MTFILIQSKINYVCLFKDVHSLFVYWRMKMFEKNKEKMKEKMEPDKVLRFAIVAVILLFLIGALIIGAVFMSPRLI